METKTDGEPVIIRCRRCERKLKDQASKELGIGPVCRKKEAEGDWA